MANKYQSFDIYFKEMFVGLPQTFLVRTVFDQFVIEGGRLKPLLFQF